MSLLPLFPLDLVLFPGTPLPLHIFEPRYREMISECLDQKKSFGVVRAKEEGVAEIGCTAEIITVTQKYPDGRMDIVTEGRERFEVMQVNQERSFLQAEVLYLQDEPEQATAEEIAQAVKLQGEIIELAGSSSASPSEIEGPQLSFNLVGTASARSRFQADPAGDEVGSGAHASGHFLLRGHLAEFAADGAGASEGRRQRPCSLTEPFASQTHKPRRTRRYTKVQSAPSCTFVSFVVYEFRSAETRAHERSINGV